MESVTFQRFQNKEHLRYQRKKKTPVNLLVLMRTSLGTGSFRMSSMSKASLGDEVLFDKMTFNLMIASLRIIHL